jgi:hypothetical protein|tara:strand:+ start:800 stop:1039 length:240 start_codon:yes stop_codon:yes gene_type:complete
MSYTRPAEIDAASIPKKQLLKILDKKYHYAINNLVITCIINDFKWGYGRLRIQIAPVEGEGQTWVEPTNDQLQALLQTD